MFPLAQDTAVFPAATYPASGSTTTINANYNIGTIDMSLRTSNTMTLATGATNPAFCGNWINGTGITISGTGIIMSSDMGDLLVKEEPHHCPDCDDVFISRKLVHYAPMHLLSASMMYYLTDDPQNVHNVIPENKNDILYFRIKNGQNRQRDVELFKILLRDMYDIHA
jgi:hypothetical protein